MRSSTICVPGSVPLESPLQNDNFMPKNDGPMDPMEDMQRLRNVTLSKTVGLYRLRGDLGSGNFSRVKMAIHHPTNERVAIKILDKTKLDEKTRKMLAREIATMEGICHPHVIRLFEVVETYARIYLVTEYASGGELFEKISVQGRFKEEEAKLLFVQILSAVKYMHTLGFIHRDIKAENVFYAGPGLIKLGDFGFSTRLTDGPDQVLKTFCGSPPYAAPELFRDESYLGPYVDIWALGVLLYLVVTGTMPFRARTVLGLKTLILEGKFFTPDHVSLPCQSLICGLLCQTPLERLTIDQMLASEWLKDTTVPPHTPFQDCLLLPTITSDPNQIPGIERVARLMLEKLGIDGNLLATHADKGPRSSVIGTYRIVVHRLTKPPRNPVQPDTSSVPKTSQSLITKKGLKSKMCLIL
ncbi:serine/threonine-protein kinase NIM1-like [Neodiprion pinetum]|uniref:serine/threonine-protein kinase NIM1-like n=1 Tax=Neodiprion pinetum TaxID=441929 RepID=UPI001EDE2C13|nr:serine/threonine-protein kinase NIM1-like [Neodiprion pinetum]XP_046489823.1 serine/threonine-protein kinase NIM1-like [Neodiprion pinetum]